MGEGMNSEVTSLAFVGDTLYAGGYFSEAGGVTAYGLAFWDGQNWQQRLVEHLLMFNIICYTRYLFVGGNFNYVGSENKTYGLYAADP